MSEVVYNSTLSGKMIASTKVFGLPVASSNKEYEIGDLLIDPTTKTIYQYVQATAAGIAANATVSSANGLTVATSPATAAGVATCAGVAPYAFTASQYGFIAKSGNITTSVSGTVNSGDIVAADLASAGNAITVAPGAAYAQADAVASLKIIGVATSGTTGGAATICLRGLL